MTKSNTLKSKLLISLCSTDVFMLKKTTSFSVFWIISLFFFQPNVHVRPRSQDRHQYPPNIKIGKHPQNLQNGQEPQNTQKHEQPKRFFRIGLFSCVCLNLFCLPWALFSFKFSFNYTYRHTLNTNWTFIFNNLSK
jgi:hypothetical protein